MADTPKWFDVDTYMANKLIQVQTAEPDANWTAESLAATFVANDFGGTDGAYNHFVAFGAKEDVSPNALFSADQYYTAKAAQFYDKAPSAVSALEVATVKGLIKDAGMNAWTHYQAYGASEGVNPSNDFDSTAYMEAKLALMKADDPNYTMDNLEAAFAAAGYSPLEHFLTFGGLEGEVQEPSFPVPDEERVPGETGKPFDLTPDRDEVTGTSGSDVIIGSTTDGKVTFTAGDTIDGGAGEDTLKLYSQNNIAKGQQFVKNVENLEVFGNATGANGTHDVSAWEGLEKATFKAGAVTKLTANATLTDVVLDDTTGNSELIGDGITNVTVKNTDAAHEITVTNATEAHALNVTLDNASKLDKDDAPTTSVTVKDTAAATLNLTSNGTANNVTLTADSAALTALTISGEAALKAVGLSTVTTLASIDGSAAKGDLDLGTLAAATVSVKTGEGDDTFTMGANTAAIAVATGAGDDDVTLGANLVKGSTIDLGAGDDSLSMVVANLSKDATVNGGEGYDTLVFTADADFTNAGNLAALKATTGFEELGIKAGTAQTLTVNGATVGFNDFLVAGTNTVTSSITTTLTLTGAQNGNTVTFAAGTEEITSSNNFKVGTETATITMAAHNNSLNLNLEGSDAAVADATVTATGATTINIDSFGLLEEKANAATDDNNVLKLTGDNATLKLTGDQDLTLTLTETASLTNGFLVDATGFEAKLNVTGSAQGDIIKGSAQADTIWGGAGKDTLTGGEGADQFVLATAASMVGAAGANVNTITDFTAGVDTFLFDVSGSVTGTALTAVDAILKGVTFTANTAAMAKMAAVVTDTTAVADLDAVYTALTTSLTKMAASAANGTATVAQVVTFTTGDAAGTYLVINDATAGFAADADVVINITGMEGTLSAADFAFA